MQSCCVRFVQGEFSIPEYNDKVRGIIEGQAQTLPTPISFSSAMTKLVSVALELLNYNEGKDILRYKVAGLVVFDCLIDVNDEIMPERKIEIANHICKVLENDKLPFTINETILRTAAASIGHFARVATNTEAEFLQNYYYPLAQKLLQDVRSEAHRLAGVLVLAQLAQNVPTLIFSKRKILFNVLWDVISDKSAIVRQSASIAFECSMQVISQRESMAEYVRNAFRQIEQGLSSTIHEKNLGALQILDTLLSGSVITLAELFSLIREQVQELIWKFFQKKDSKDSAVKQKVIELIPKVGGAFSSTFLQPNPYSVPNNYLGYSLKFLMEIIAARKDRGIAYISLGKLFQVLSSYFKSYPNVVEILQVIYTGLQEPFCSEALVCLGMVISVSLPARKCIDEVAISSIFRGGLTNELAETAKMIVKYIPSIRSYVQKLLRDKIQMILTNHVVNIDDSLINRPTSVRIQKVTGNTAASTTTGKSYLWGGGGHGMFGTGQKSETVVETVTLTPRSEEMLLFALKMLAVSDFLPKQQRDKSVDDEYIRELLMIARDLVLRYTDDFNPVVRKSAATACAKILDAVVPSVDTQSIEFCIVYQVLDRLLVMGVGDDDDEIRHLVFVSLSPSMDLALSLTDNVHCLIEALNDETLQVRAAAMTVLSRVAHFDTLHVMPIVRLTLKRLLTSLNFTVEAKVKQECVHILQALVRGSGSLMVPYVKEVIAPLMSLLNEPSTDVVVSALSTVGELATASPVSVREHLDELAPRLIEALNDQSSLLKQKTAVIAMGKLVSSLTMITDEPFKKYNGLFEGLVKAMQSSDDSSSELRLQAIKTLGLLGVADATVYQKYLSNLTGGTVHQSDEFSAEVMDLELSKGNEEEKSLSKMEKYYLSAVIRALSKVIKDHSLSQYHQTASSLAIRAFRMVGVAAHPQVPELMKSILFLLNQQDSSNNTKEALLDHIISLIQIMGRYMKRFRSELLQTLNSFVNNHTNLCMDMFEALSVVFSTPDFQALIQGFIPTLQRIIRDECAVLGSEANTLDEGQESDTNITTFLKSPSVSSVPSKSTVPTSAGRILQYSPTAKISKIFQIIVSIGDSLGEYRKDSISMVLDVLDNPFLVQELRKNAICTIVNLSKETDLREFAGKIIHSLLRFMTTAEGVALSTIFTTLSIMVCRLGTSFIPYIIPVRRKLKAISQREGFQRSSKLEEYESLVSRLLKERPLPDDPSDVLDVMMAVDIRVRHRASTARAFVDNSFQMNIPALETAWALADRSNPNNLVEWMRRLMIELIRQSPSNIIRLCATLAKSHRPLAEELFNAAFFSVWDELYGAQVHDVVIDIPLINGMEMALSSPHCPKNITIALLNLVEFMEIKDKPLPVNVVLIAKQAQSANMFAKCLKYREIEFGSKIVPPSFDCIDALITVNNQLGLSDRAIGILRAVRHRFQSIEIQPQWLEKLCRWDDAHKAYETEIKTLRGQSDEGSPLDDKRWLDLELGRLRCLRAIADYEELELRSKRLKDDIKSKDEIILGQSLSQVQCLGAKAAWMLGKWDLMEDFIEGDVKRYDNTDVLLEQNGSFFQAIFAIHQKDYSKASALVGETRVSLSNSINSLLSESYSRAYRGMVAMQILAELDEVIEFKQWSDKLSVDSDAVKAPADDGIKPTDTSKSAVASELTAKKLELVRKWRARLKWAPRDVEVFQQILSVHTLVAEPVEDLDSWLELVSLCRKEGMFSLCSNILRKLGAPLPPRRSTSQFDLFDQYSATDGLHGKPHDRVLYSTFQFWWSTGEKSKALTEITSFLKSRPLSSSVTSSSSVFSSQDAASFRVRCLLKCSLWMRELEQGDVQDIMELLLEARELAKDEYSVWHAWAVANFDQLKKADSKQRSSSIEEDIQPAPVFTPLPNARNVANLSGSAQHSRTPPISTFLSPTGLKASKMNSYFTPKKLSNAAGSTLLSMQQADKVTPFAIEAIKGFVRSIILGQGQPIANLLQDTLRLITLWFSYGTKKGVLAVLDSELLKVSPDNWLGVVPQLIARIHIKSPEISGLLRKLLTKVAAAHPQALVCPISVALNTSSTQQHYVATEVLQEMRKSHRKLVEEATIVSRELMKVAITPQELWYDSLEQAAQSYIDAKDIPSMMYILKELHDTMSEQHPSSRKIGEGFTDGIGKIGVSTLRDVTFRHTYGKLIQDAHYWIEQFRLTGRTVDLHQAWEIYHQIFRKVRVQINSLKKLELHHVSVLLMDASNWSLAVPGTYKPGSKDICISGFSPTVHVISSKQRPRRMSVLGSDGRLYQFLLKGHEDLRQDERVMQLFGLINVCLQQDRITSERGLGIVRYSVLPLSNNSGLIGWVENCDTMNQLVKSYRESKDIPLYVERILLERNVLRTKGQNPNYDKLPLIHKVELFRHVLSETTGEDLAKMVWLKSKTSDAWIEHRVNFTKSLAVMSMAGYILGLGDRHPSNLMIDRISGQVVHIDFGDCFEITAHRSKFPEIIPFRLTRMLTNCMESAGVQGTYRITSERVMRVLRENRDSLMAMLEAFVYDPLISWRLLAQEDTNEGTSKVNSEEIGHPRSPIEDIAISASGALSSDHGSESLELSPKRPIMASSVRDVSVLRRTISNDKNETDEPLQENLNTRALEVVNRIQAKLTGRDFLKPDDDESEDFTIEQQVDRLIQEATSIENLCQLFTGWCALW